MNATAAKAQRRDLRRAMGEDAVRLVEAHEQGLKMHAAALQRHEQLFEVQRKAREALKKDLEHAIDDVSDVRGRQIMDVYAALREFQLRSFCGRLRWLLTGR